MSNLAYKDKYLTDIFKDFDFNGCDIETLNGLKVLNINAYTKSRKIELFLASNKIIPASQIVGLEKSIADCFKLSEVKIKIRFDIDKSFEEFLNIYFNDIIYLVNKNFVSSVGLLLGAKWEVLKEKLIIKLQTKGSSILKSRSCDIFIEELIKDFLGLKIKVIFEDCKVNDDVRENYLEEKASAEAKLVNDTVTSHFNPPPVKNVQKNGSETPKFVKSRKKSKPCDILGKTFDDQLIDISEINQESGTIAVKGEIFRVEIREIRNEKMLVVFDITDFTSSITIKAFVKKEEIEPIYQKIKEGQWVRVRGDVQYDKFSREICVFALDIMSEANVEPRMDLAPEKRVELHLHTQMSSMDAVSSASELIKRAAKWGHKAIAITDHGVVQAYPEAYEAAKKNNIKLIYGMECYLINDKIGDTFEENVDIKKKRSFHAVILVKNMQGLKNLYKIVSKSHLEYFYKRPRVLKSLLMQYREGLILGTACEAGELFCAFLENKSESEIEEIACSYDYFEIQPLGNNAFLVEKGKAKDEEQLKDINKKIVTLGANHGKPVVATCDVHFMDPRDEVFRRILMAGKGFDDADNQAPLFFRTTDEMLLEFNYLGDMVAYDVVVKNTNLISDMIEEVLPVPEGTFPPRIDGAEQEIRELALNRAKEIYGEKLPEIVEKRLEKELNSIINNGFSVMYIIAMRLVLKSLEDGYLVGSRGSVGSSFVAYLIGITEVNSLPAHYVCKKCKYSEFIIDNQAGCGFDLPQKACPVCGEILNKDGYDIPFETFLGFEGDKEPDIDLNFSGEYQPMAHKYTEELFGKGHVYRAGTIATIAEKTAYGFVKNYFEERKLVINNAEINRLIKGCSGVKRTTGQHPGGVMIVPADKEIYEFCPIQRPADDTGSDIITTHFDYHSISGRLLKLDILGHDDPTVIKMLEDLTGVDARSIPIGEERTMGIFSGTEPLGITPEDINSEVGTFAIPEFGTKFVRQMLVDTKPKTFAELIRISGLSHGTDVWLNNAQELIRQEIATLKEVICTRDDIMLYLMGANLKPKHAFKIMENVRKGKGLSKEDMDAMLENGVPKWYIDSCNKIKYMFPKAHAAAYVMMAFRIAFFKVYYPEAFYVTYFTVRADDFDASIMMKDRDTIRKKIKEYEKMGNEATQKEKNVLTILEVVNEMYAREIRFLPIDLHESDAYKFEILQGSIRPPLMAIQGLGGQAAQSIVEARKHGRFISVEDLRIRAKVSKTVIEVLKQEGCLDGMPESSQVSFF